MAHAPSKAECATVRNRLMRTISVQTRTLDPVLFKNSNVLAFKQDRRFLRDSLPRCRRVWIHVRLSSSPCQVG
jgi:hypothetical protein